MKCNVFASLFVFTCAFCGGGALSNEISQSLVPVYIDKNGNVISFSYPVEVEGGHAVGVKNAVDVSGNIIVDSSGDIFSFLWSVKNKKSDDHEVSLKFFGVKKINVVGAVKKVSSSKFGTLLLMKNGQVLGFGKTRMGLLEGGGLGSSDISKLLMNKKQVVEDDSPVVVPLPEEMVDVSTNGANSLALGKSGKIYAWGDNSYGAVGEGARQGSISFSVISGIQGVYRVYAGRFHGYAINEAGEVYVWGGCPQNGNINSGVPFKLPGVFGVIGLSLPDFDEYRPVFFLNKNGEVFRMIINGMYYNPGSGCALRSERSLNSADPSVIYPSGGDKIIEISDTYSDARGLYLGVDSTGKLAVGHSK